ncbi:hypothetical protein [Lelliottia sp. SL45]|uniref:hypothetical protein n=1 Tax=Lelliottia sp. SL45 TaxID=2994665 RepID=UPI003FA3461A
MVNPAVKRSLITEAYGLSLSLGIVAANTHDKVVADAIDVLQTRHPGQKIMHWPYNSYDAGWLKHI